MAEIVLLWRDVLGAVWRKGQSDHGLGELVLYGFLVVHAAMWGVLMCVVVPVALLRWIGRW